MAWFKLHGGNVAADSNAYDRYQGPQGRATVFRRGREVFGFIAPWDGPERAWGPVEVPGEGNVQAVRIFPESAWVVYLLMDPRDGERAEWGMAVAPR